jgi:hypothetical protein
MQDLTPILFKASAHAAAVDVDDWQMHHCARPQARIIGDLQQRLVAQGLGTGGCHSD